MSAGRLLLIHYSQFLPSNYKLLAESGRQGPVRVQEGGRGGEVLRHHLQRPRGEQGGGHTAQGQGGQTLRPEENLQSGESHAEIRGE